MLLKSRNVAYAGMMAAVTVLCLFLSSVLEANTLFLLAAASFLAGSVYRFSNLGLGGGFTLACFLLGLLLAPNKLYCFTYLGFAVYVLAAEYFRQKKRTGLLVKGILYHILMVIALFCAWKLFGMNFLLSTKWLKALYNIPVVFWCAVIMVLEIVWVVFDRAYLFFQQNYGHYILPEK